MKDTVYNTIYDLVVLGGGDAGLAFMKKLNEQPKSAQLKTIWVSDSFTANSEKFSAKANLITYKNKVDYIDYFRGLVYLSFGPDKLFCKKLVLAPGSKPQQYNIPGISQNLLDYSADKLYKQLKDQKEKQNCLAIVSNIDRLILESAIKFTRFFDKVIILTEEFEYSITEAMQAKLKPKAKCLKIIPGCHIKGGKKGINELICELSTYTELPVNKILINTARLPDLAQFSSPLIQLDDRNYPELIDNCESTKIPIVYIISEPNSEYNINNIISKIIDKIF